MTSDAKPAAPILENSGARTILTTLSSLDREVRKSELHRLTGLSRDEIRGLMFSLVRHGLVTVFPGLSDNRQAEDADDFGIYRIRDRGRVLVEANFSWNTAYERALDEIEWLIRARGRDSAVAKRAYEDAYVQISHTDWKERPNLRPALMKWPGED